MEKFKTRAACTATVLGLTSILAMASVGSPTANLEGKSSNRDTMERMIVLLDGYIQNRFEQDEDRFGLMRLPPPVSGHGNIVYKLTAADAREKEILAAVTASKYEYLVEFVHCAHVPGSFSNTRRSAASARGPKGITLIAAKSAAAPFLPYSYGKEREEFTKTTEDPLYKAAEALLPKLQRGDSCDTKVGDWRVALRPIRASKASCLNCHQGANGGDTLGVMLYAVRAPAKTAAGDGAVAKSSSP